MHKPLHYCRDVFRHGTGRDSCFASGRSGRKPPLIMIRPRHKSQASISILTWGLTVTLISRPESEGTMQITSPVFGNVWRILCRPGDVIESGDTTVAILEAMKTEVPVKAGMGGVGKRVVGFGPGIREGGSVRPGDVLVVLK